MRKKTKLQTVTVIGFVSLLIGCCTMSNVKIKSNCSRFLGSHSNNQIIKTLQVTLEFHFFIQIRRIPWGPGFPWSPEKENGEIQQVSFIKQIAYIIDISSPEKLNLLCIQQFFSLSLTFRKR